MSCDNTAKIYKTHLMTAKPVVGTTELQFKMCCANTSIRRRMQRKMLSVLDTQHARPGPLRQRCPLERNGRKWLVFSDRNDILAQKQCNR